VLAEHFKAVFGYQIEINQAEISYVNLIPVGEFAEEERWFTVCNSGSVDVETLNTNFVQVVRDRDRKPYARFVTEIQSVFTLPSRKKALKMSLLFKGKPAASDVPSAIAFLRDGRKRIVKHFCGITTVEAHEFWGRRA